jgi:hypothetical protein
MVTKVKGSLATLAAALAMLGAASGANGSITTHGSIAGVVPHLGQSGIATSGLLKSAPFLTHPSLSFGGSYVALINRYFTDVAHDSGGVANVYSADTQYYDDPGHVHIQYLSAVGGSFIDNGPLPANGCDDGLDPICLTDQQLQNEIQRVLTATGWHGGLGNMFFLMTPDGVGSCVDGVSNECSTNVFCAYHNYFVDTSSEDVIYANEPFEATIGGCTNPVDQGFPNDADADTTINTISHEHNEAITDPLTDPSNLAWLADDGPGGQPGDEIGDLCAYDVGTEVGGTPGVDAYNQVINGHHYDLQAEYSNADSGCVLNAGGAVSSPPFPEGSGPLVYQGGPVMHTNTTYAIYWAPTAGNITAPVVTGTAAVSHVLTSSQGSWNGSATGFSYQWQRCSSAGTGCVNISGATASSYTLTSADGGSTVRSTVSATNVNGASPFAPSATTAVVAPVPAATGAPVVSGIAAVGRSFSTTNGAWNTSVSFTYQWLRCASDGSGCAAIPAATASSYPLVSADAGHVLKAVVSAANAAGTTSATSPASAMVVAAPHISSLPRISGKAKVGKRLTGTRGAWSGPPQTYRYAWLRCNSHGSKCVPIGKATHTTYRVTSHDAGHRLRLRVTATNAAGSRTAMSGATKRVTH